MYICLCVCVCVCGVCDYILLQNHMIPPSSLSRNLDMREVQVMAPHSVVVSII